MNEKELFEFVETTKKLIEKKPQMNESNTKPKVIVPLLELLGWNIKFDVELEYPIRVGSTISKVDYALSIDGKPTVLVEAKGFDSNITDDFAEQAISYGRIAEIKWAALTNGKSVHIYDTTRGRFPKDCIIDKIDIDEFIEKKASLSLLSKKSIENNETDSIVERIQKKKEYINYLIQNKEDITHKISNILKKQADKELYKKIEETSDVIFENIINEFKKSSMDNTIIEKSQLRKDTDSDLEKTNELKGSEEKKIGKLVRDTLKELAESNAISDHELDNLIQKNYSKSTFNLPYPFLKKIKEEISISEQGKVNERLRYWSVIFTINGEKYIACNHWIEKNRLFFMEWFMRIKKSQGLG